MKKPLLIALLILVAVLAWIAVRRDSRLVGVYVPNAAQTHLRWSFGESLGIDGVKAVLSQIFSDRPVQITDRTMILHTARGVETNRFWILAKGATHCTVYMPPTSIFRFELVDDGLWFERRFGIPREKFPLLVKLTQPHRSPREKDAPADVVESETTGQGGE